MPHVRWNSQVDYGWFVYRQWKFMEFWWLWWQFGHHEMPNQKIRFFMLSSSTCRSVFVTRHARVSLGKRLNSTGPLICSSEIYHLCGPFTPSNYRCELEGIQFLRPHSVAVWGKHRLNPSAVGMLVCSEPCSTTVHLTACCIWSGTSDHNYPSILHKAVGQLHKTWRDSWRLHQVGFDTKQQYRAKLLNRSSFLSIFLLP